MSERGYRHFVNGQSLDPPYPAGTEQAVFAMGCFWGVERLYWPLAGVHVTAVGYAGGPVAKPDYRMVCTGRTGHAEVVRVVYRPDEIGYGELLRVFWEHHDPTQGNRQGNDVGTQYRSAIYTTSAAQLAAAEASRAAYAPALKAAGLGPITTEIRSAPEFWMAEEYHQQYLAKNPDGYCGIGGCGVPFKPAEVAVGEKA
jgi:peptide-methionine (S)-S-oxide reductase